MSLTRTDDVFAAIHEDGLNDLLRRFFAARPRRLSYGSPAFVAATTVLSTQMPAIQFPGIPGGIDWSIRMARPRVDAHPQTSSLPPELDPLAAQRLSIRTAVELCINCTTDHRRRDPAEEPNGQDDGRQDDGRQDDGRQDDGRQDDGRQDDGRQDDGRQDDSDPREQEQHPDKPPRGELKPVCWKVEVFAITHAERTSSPDGDAIRLIVDALELVDVEPGELESVLECLLLQILRAVLASVRLPLPALRAGAFSLVPTVGPEIDNDQVEMLGSI